MQCGVHRGASDAPPHQMEPFEAFQGAAHTDVHRYTCLKPPRVFSSSIQRCTPPKVLGAEKPLAHHQLMNPSHGSCIFPAKPITSTTLSGLELSLDSGGFQATSRPLHLDPAFSTLPECCESKATKAAVFPLTTSSMKLPHASRPPTAPRLDHTLVAAAGASLFAGIICHICGY